MIVEKLVRCGPITGICKQHGLWAQQGNCTSPIVYLQRPKWIESDECWETIVNSVTISLPEGFEIK